MKIFLDTANVAEIKNWSETGLVDGVTTNPTHLSKEGGNPVEVIKKICEILPEGSISVEVTETAPRAVYHQAKEIAALAQNIVVKVPCSKNYYEIIRKLVKEKVKINITLLFTLPQALYMCKLGVHYISPFIGRLNDIDVDGLELIDDLRLMIDEYGYETQILAASLRTVRQLHRVILSGADVVTLPLKVFEKSLEHPLTDQGMKKFLDDWKKLGITKFP